MPFEDLLWLQAYPGKQTFSEQLRVIKGKIGAMGDHEDTVHERSRIIAPSHFVGLLNELAMRKEFEQELEAQNVLLEKRVEERTAALHEAKNLAESATATKSRFLAAASHDLRQPLQSLGLYLATISRQFDEPKLQDICDSMRQSLNTMGEMLDALIDISKLDSGSVTPQKRDIRLQELFYRIVTNNIQQAKSSVI